MPTGGSGNLSNREISKRVEYRDGVIGKWEYQNVLDPKLCPDSASRLVNLHVPHWIFIHGSAQVHSR